MLNARETTKTLDTIDAELDALVTLAGLTAAEDVSPIVTQRAEVSLRLLQRVRTMLGTLAPCDVPSIEVDIAALPSSFGWRCQDAECMCNHHSFADDMLAVPEVASLAVDKAIDEEAA